MSIKKILSGMLAVSIFAFIGCGDSNSGDKNPVGSGGSSYTVTFNANEGTVSPESGITGTDGKLTSLPTPTRNNYSFNGWFTAISGGTEVTTNHVFSANTTIYARWTAEFSNGFEPLFYASVQYTLEAFKSRLAEGQGEFGNGFEALFYASAQYTLEAFKNRLAEAQGKF